MRCGSFHWGRLLLSGFFAVLFCVMMPATSDGQCDAPVCYADGPATGPAASLEEYYHKDRTGVWLAFYVMLIPQTLTASVFGYYIVTAFRPVRTDSEEDLAFSIHILVLVGLVAVASVILVPVNHAYLGCEAPVCYGVGSWAEFFAVLTVQFFAVIVFWRLSCVVADEWRNVLSARQQGAARSD